MKFNLLKILYFIRQSSESYSSFGLELKYSQMGAQLPSVRADALK